MNPFVIKAAGKPYAAGLAPEAAAHNNALKAEALRRAFKTGLLGLAGGAGLAGLLGLPQLLNRPKIPSYPLQTEVELPYPQIVSAEEHDRHRRAPELLEAEKAGAVDASPSSVGSPLFYGALGAYEGRQADDKLQGALYGGARGVLSGAAALPGALAGSALGQQLLERGRLGARMRQAGGHTAGKLTNALLPLLGGLGGGLVARRVANPFVNATAEKLMGPVPKVTAKKDDSKAEKIQKAEKQADVADALVHGLGLAAKPGAPAPTLGSPRWMRGDSQQDVGAIPWAMPAAVGAGLGGLFGGHALVRHILKKRRKAELEQEMGAAQKEYEEAMLSQYDPSKLRHLTGFKEAAAPATALDACFDLLEKAAFLGLPSFDDMAGRGTGLYLTGAGLLGTGAGIGTYKWLQSRSGEKTLKDALKRRALLRALANPEEMYVRPVPVEYVEDKKEGPA
jgi:hypothetical protein